MKSKLQNPKRYIGINSNNKKEEMVLQLVDEMVLGVVDKVTVKTGTKHFISIMIKDMKIIVAHMVVIKFIVAMVATIILVITMKTMDMDQDMQTTLASRALTARCVKGLTITKTITSHTKGECWRKQEGIAKVNPSCRTTLNIAFLLIKDDYFVKDFLVYKTKLCPTVYSSQLIFFVFTLSFVVL
ncbi:unnamed protein product [Gulo gulo]|uniref:Uncharacterized protein n=1 Tax=Gulo gulo TaxID=48420 RepID=A0A9X9MEF4_GULGU|nr:unnamed protein product [Gulo gulo]